MQPEIIEIPPRFSRSSNMRKQKQVIMHDVIDVDKEEDSDDVMFIDEKVHKSKKGKEKQDVSDGCGGHQAKVILDEVIDVDKEEDSDDVMFIDEKVHKSKKRKEVQDVSDGYGDHQAKFESMDFPPGIKAPTSTNLENDSYTSWSYLENLPPRMLWQPHPLYLVDLPFFYVPVYEFYAPIDVKKFPWLRPSSQKNRNNAAAEPIVANSGNDKNEILRRFKLFKQFDIVKDYSDHYYATDGFTAMQTSKTWAKKIQEEWKILEKDLPDNIFVRVYERRMDLLRAVIIGTEGTPYHDGLFFFDFFFDFNHPNVPPKFHYHSWGLKLNPAFNKNGSRSVCLCLYKPFTVNHSWGLKLNPAFNNSYWHPGVSTMLQLLVSLQGLILNTRPFNWHQPIPSDNTETQSRQYDEDVFVLLLRTMTYTMRSPPKHFEDFVVGHFCNRGCDILVACRAYMDGAQVGSVVKGGVKDVNMDDKSCSQRFKNSVAVMLILLSRYFTEIGAEDCKKFLLPVLPATAMKFESMDFPPGIEAPTSRLPMPHAVDAYVPWFYWENLIWQPSSSFGLSSFHVLAFEFYAPKDVKKFPWLQPSAQNQNNAAAEPIKAISGKEKYEILRRFKLFKQFDIVEEYSDHYYASYGSTTMQPSETWAKKIREEWKILEKDLPDKIFVRVYEKRMDLLRAVIVGTEGTPYHDGLFFFDFFFDSYYPNVAPKVHYHSGGLELTPQMSNDGSKYSADSTGHPLGDGRYNNFWLPGVSTMLQLLVSIQVVFFNTKPSFNLPPRSSAYNEKQCQVYNEDHFEDFVVGHFCNCGRDILVACRAYMDGAPLGSVKGGVKDVNMDDRCSSRRFRNSLAVMLMLLSRYFTEIGAEDCKEFLLPKM
ncbi:putative ubiquitin-conjugating enzyme e2 26 [Quercus suber]|uniref:Ubiquitin-conjugating enzyme e2 26 n=1 Tax=Quercus suber TaxID=58331 RepID=A0AAW0LFK9_QUESU